MDSSIRLISLFIKTVTKNRKNYVIVGVICSVVVIRLKLIVSYFIRLSTKDVYIRWRDGAEGKKRMWFVY